MNNDGDRQIKNRIKTKKYSQTTSERTHCNYNSTFFL